jgi:hypothetical protein
VTGFDDDYGEDPPEQDLAAQLAQAQAERKAAEEKLNGLQRRHSEAGRRRLSTGRRRPARPTWMS